MKHPKLLLSALLISAAFTLIAQTNFQPVYYINNNNDTIFGEIDNRSDLRNGRICSYRADREAGAVHLMPGDIAAYRFIEEKYYVSRNMEINQKVHQILLEYFVNGVSSLYYHRSENGDHYFIENALGDYTELTNEYHDFVCEEEQECII